MPAVGSPAAKRVSSPVTTWPSAHTAHTSAYMLVRRSAVSSADEKAFRAGVSDASGARAWWVSASARALTAACSAIHFPIAPSDRSCVRSISLPDFFHVL